MASLHQGRIGAGLYEPLTQHLSPLGSDQQIIDAVGTLLEELTRAGVLPEQPSSGVYEVLGSAGHRAIMKLPVSKRVFAVPDSELKIWESGAKTAALFIGASITGGPIGVEKVAGGLVTGMIASVFTVLIAFWKKRAVLPQAQGELLLALKKRPNSTVEGLLMHLPPEIEVSVEQATSLLQGLRKARLQNGDEVAFVNEQDGRWWAVDV